jgi:ribosome biogenesis protein MAK21
MLNQSPKELQPKIEVTTSKDSDGKDNFGPYDPLKREPSYARAQNSCLWELDQLACHFHPSVSKFATSLLKGEYITYKGDPVQDLSLMGFLDKFGLKNPKKNLKKGGIGTMKPKHTRNSYLKLQTNDPNFLDMSKDKVDESEVASIYFI